MKRLLCALLAGALLAACAAGGAEPLPELVLRYADNQSDTYPTTRAAQYFADLVAERTGGRVQVRVFADSALGDEVSVVEQLRFGGIDFARASLSTMTGACPALAVLQLPCLYDDADQMWRVLDGGIGDTFLDTVREADIVGLSWFDAGARSFYTDVPVTGLEDFAGLRIRVQENEMMSEMVALLGAVPQQIAYADVYAALMSGRVDGAENNWASYESTGHYEAAPYMFLDEHARIPEMQIMSTVAEEQLAALDPAYPDLVRDCAKESALYERELWNETESAARQHMLETGCVLTVPGAATLAELRARMQPFYDALSEEERALVARIRAA